MGEGQGEGEISSGDNTGENGVGGENVGGLKAVRNPGLEQQAILRHFIEAEDDV
jgi:hypothetical protein